MKNVEMGSWVYVVKGTTCDSCKKPILAGDVARVTGFGGYSNPVYYYVCESCNEKSEVAYQASCFDVEMKEMELAEMEC